MSFAPQIVSGSNNRRRELGSMALEQILFIGAAIFVAGTGLKVLLGYLNDYYDCFTEEQNITEQCKQRSTL